MSDAPGSGDGAAAFVVGVVLLALALAFLAWVMRGQ